jgi:serine/threonine-protein kinase
VYDEVLSDIFQVQSDIARQVSQQLGAAMFEEEIPGRSTDSLEAYDHYLKGNEFLNRSYDLDSEEDARKAASMFQNARELDPNFALAYAHEARAHAWLYQSFWDDDRSRLEQARKAALRSVELSPELPEAHHAMASVHLVENRFAEALEALHRVLEAQPNNADVYEDISSAQMFMGLWKESAESKKKALELNPGMGRVACSTGGAFFGLRDFPEAIRYHDKAIRATPDRACPYFCEVRIYLNWDGDTGRAREVLEGLPADMGLEEEPPIAYPWVLAELIDGDYEAALERLGAGPSKAYSFRQFFIPKDLLYGQIYRLMGQEERAREHYDSARKMLEAKLEDSPEDHRLRGSLGIAYAGLGRKEDAVREGRIGRKTVESSRAEIRGERTKELAEIYTMVGEYELALEQLEDLLSRPTFYAVALLRVDPTWRELRPLPGFQAMLERHATDAITTATIDHR